MFSDHNGIKWEMDGRKSAGKSPNICSLNNMFWYDAWVKGEISREVYKYFELNKEQLIKIGRM